MKNGKEKWRRLRSKQFAWLYTMIFSFGIAILMLIALCLALHKSNHITGIVMIGIIGTLCIALVYCKLKKTKVISKQMETFIRRNGLCQSNYAIKQGIFGERSIEVMDYYPIVEYLKKKHENVFYIRIRMDGSQYAERFRDLERPLADMFCTICTEKIEERGFLTYGFELQPQKQVNIQSCKDIPQAGDNEIAFSHDIIWNFRTCPHLLVTGGTGTGKTQLVAYIISCLTSKGVRVIYCDPKNDDDIRQFMQSHPSVTYVTKENDIAKAVRETEEEVRLRERDMKSIGIKEAEFTPIYLFFDEMIAFAKIAEKKTYEETSRRISTIIVTGRSKHIYGALILQRPDIAFIEGAIRDNLGCRICMGQMSDTAYKMAFGSDFADVKNLRREIGSGLIYRQGVDTKPREFLAPYIEKGALSRE